MSDSSLTILWHFYFGPWRIVYDAAAGTLTVGGFEDSLPTTEAEQHHLASTLLVIAMLDCLRGQAPWTQDRPRVKAPCFTVAVKPLVNALLRDTPMQITMPEFSTPAISDDGDSAPTTPSRDA